MPAGGELVADREGALTAGGEVGVEGVALVSGLDEQGPVGGYRLNDRAAGLRGDGGRDGSPGLLLRLGHLFPRRQGSGLGLAVGLVGGPGEVIEAGTAHLIDDARANGVLADSLEKLAAG